MIMFIKTIKWYGVEYPDVEDAADNAQSHVDCGNVVIFADSVGTFADKMGVKADDVELVE